MEEIQDDPSLNVRVDYVEFSGVQVRTVTPPGPDVARPALNHMMSIRLDLKQLPFDTHNLFRLQHGFILPEDLTPCKLVGTGSAGVVLCCTTEHGEMVAVKKIRSETEQEQQRALREVGPGYPAILIAT